jgi:hypothetical protein
MSFLDPLGIFDGGGGASASVSSSVTVDVKGLDKIGLTEKVTLDPIEIKPLSLTEKVTVDPLELKPLTINENLNVQPLTLNENIDLKPVAVAETIDLKPVAVDSCQTLRLAPLPETTVCNPYRHHVSMTLFGIEVMALNYHGESEQTIHSPHRQAHGAERTGYPVRPPSGPRVLGDGPGIRVRVVDHDH